MSRIVADLVKNVTKQIVNKKRKLAVVANERFIKEAEVAKAA
jgi:hypothetical protein